MNSRPSKPPINHHLLAFLIFSIAVKDSECAVNASKDPVWNIRHVLPKINLGKSTSTEVTFNVGESAFLPCSFEDFSRQETSVSWVRRWDWRILSAGIYTNTNDNRFSVLHLEGTDDWVLHIKPVKMSDSGTYECQMHTGAGFKSHFVKLTVLKPVAFIHGPDELHILAGKSFKLICEITNIISTPTYIMWLHKETPLNYAPDRPRMTVETLPDGSKTQSRLEIVTARYEDAGNYTCVSPNAVSASVMVFVTQGDAVAAIQKSSGEEEEDDEKESEKSELKSSSSASAVFRVFFGMNIVLFTIAHFKMF